MIRRATFTHYSLVTKRGTLRVLPEHRQLSRADMREGIIQVVDLDNVEGGSFPCFRRSLVWEGAS